MILVRNDLLPCLKSEKNHIWNELMKLQKNVFTWMSLMNFKLGNLSVKMVMNNDT